jgi:tRNA nucleotidyltransferase (CCA-adding enzyme)
VRDASARPARGGDWDLATSARPEDVRRIFRRTVPIGIEHGTVGVLASDGTMYEVTTFRRDVETSAATPSSSSRRPLTRTSRGATSRSMRLAWHPIHDEIRDPYAWSWPICGTCDAAHASASRRTGSPRTTCACCVPCASPGTSCCRWNRLTWEALKRRRAAAAFILSVGARARGADEGAVAHAARVGRAEASTQPSGVLEVLYPELAALTQRSCRRHRVTSSSIESAVRRLTA